MKPFLTPNIDRRGRIARAIYGTLLLIAGGVAVFYVWWVGALLILAGAFGLYEAKRAWCLLRACGIKTRL
jgi:hypothetical protein